MDETTKEVVTELRAISPETYGMTDRAASLIESLSERVGELETKLLNSGCPNCNPSKLHAILGDPAKGVSLNARVILSKQEER